MSELDLLRQLAHPVAPPSASAVAHARSRLERRMARPRRYHRRTALIASPVVAGAVAAVVLTLVSGGGGDVASAAGFLRQAAAHALKLEPVGLPAEGEYLYVKSVNVYTGTTVLRDGISFTVLEPHTREIWLGRDGGVLHQTGSAPEFLTEGDRQRWLDAGKPGLRGRAMDVSLSARDVEAVFRRDLPADPDALLEQLRQAAGGAGSGLNKQMFTLVADAFRESIVTPAQRAALYEVLARIPGVELLGPATDRAGRQGIAVAMDDAANRLRHTLIIDPQTGILLAERQAALEGNSFGVEPGRVIGSATYLVTAIVDDLRDRP